MKPSPAITEKSNNLSDVTSPSQIPSSDKIYYSKIRDLYNAKEFMNNILMITLLYSIVFLTHKFYD